MDYFVWAGKVPRCGSAVRASNQSSVASLPMLQDHRVTTLRSMRLLFGLELFKERRRVKAWSFAKKSCAQVRL